MQLLLEDFKYFNVYFCLYAKVPLYNALSRSLCVFEQDSSKNLLASKLVEVTVTTITTIDLIIV